MTNKQIAEAFNTLGKLMELHGENPFKYRSYTNAYGIMRKIERPFSEMSESELAAIPGLGKAISSKTIELIKTGQMELLQTFLDKTPPGVVQMLGVRGFGPKKVAAIWNELEIVTVGELLQAAEENRLVKLKGFGLKTQEDLKKKLRYFLQSEGLVQYATAESAIESLSSMIDQDFSGQIAIVGGAIRENQIIDGIELLVTDTEEADFLEILAEQNDGDESLSWQGIKINQQTTEKESFSWERFKLSSSENYLGQFPKDFSPKGVYSDQEICDLAKVPYIPAPQREHYEYAERRNLNELITVEDIKGIIHCHSTYSDGLHSLKEMAEYALSQGFEYMLITDHSQSAFYANGLKEDRVYQQFDEIEKLNDAFISAGHEFRIYKGIESDILNDGSLDYPEPLLQEFDCIIASIHSNLKMDINKATDRLIGAIENPYTRILGHPTGRLLLSREGYPIDHERIIDACAANEVVIELNAHPNRLDIDQQYIDQCLEKGVMISINSDAHSREAMHMIRHGVRAARKAWTPSYENLSSFSRTDFEDWLWG